MKIYKNLLYFLVITIGLTGCMKKQTKTDYYIFSKIDSIQKVRTYNTIQDDSNPPPPPPPPPPIQYRWYSNIVMIFDTADKIYIYQTEKIDQFNNSGLRPEYIEYENINFPYFIGLTPDQMVTIHTDYLIDFLKDNDEFFRLDSNYQKEQRFFFIV
jgi:hypothetical protein